MTAVLVLCRLYLKGSRVGMIVELKRYEWENPTSVWILSVTTICWFLMSLLSLGAISSILCEVLLHSNSEAMGQAFETMLSAQAAMNSV